MSVLETSSSSTLFSQVDYCRRVMLLFVMCSLLPHEFISPSLIIAHDNFKYIQLLPMYFPIVIPARGQVIM